MDICKQTAVIFSRDLCEVHPFLLGSGVGLFCSVIGAVVDYLRGRRRPAAAEDSALPGCMMLMTGGLGFTGLVALVISMFTGQVRRALWLGAGVGGGFLAGFLCLMGVWWLLLRPSEK
jgi:hypothetical protein